MRLRSSKRGSDHLGSNEPPNIKRPKQDEEEGEGEEKEMKEPKKLNAIVQNGLYAAEMFAAHIARQHVISFIVNSKWMQRCCSAVKLIVHYRRYHLSLVVRSSAHDSMRWHQLY
jgi:hypothetical protein